MFYGVRKPTKISKKAIVEAAVKKAIGKLVREQIDLRTKEGRELKGMATELIRRQQELDEFVASIQTILKRQKELSNLVSAAEKSLFKRMNELEVKTLEIAEAVVSIEEEAKYKTVRPAYEALYEKALEDLARFSMEHVKLLEQAREAEIALKRAERVNKLKVSLKTEGKKLNEQMLSKIGNWLKQIWSGLSSKLFRTNRAADKALNSLNALSAAIA